MSDPRATVERFYECFAKRDAEGMVACYAPNVRFSDPVFVDLSPDEARAMWRMLISRGKDTKIQHTGVEVDASGASGSAKWVATYTFSQTGNFVRNEVSSHFRFDGDKIIDQHDTFDFWKWAGQALGLPGKLLGWAPPFQNALRKKARGSLEAFMKKESAKS